MTWRYHFCLMPEWDWKSIPNALIGQTPGSGTDHVEHDQTFKTQPKYFSAHNDGGKRWLQKNTFVTTRNQVNSSLITNVRFTWGQHRVQGRYIGPTVEYYRCYKVYISNTSTERITDTVGLFPENTTMSVFYSTDAATNLISELKIYHQRPRLYPKAEKNLMHLENFEKYSKSKSYQKPNLRQLKHRPK